MVEQGTENPRVGGSTPSPGTMIFKSFCSVSRVVSEITSTAGLPLCFNGFLAEPNLTADPHGRQRMLTGEFIYSGLRYLQIFRHFVRLE